MRIDFSFSKARRKCKVCGKSFIPNCPTQKYCSGKCRKVIQDDTNRQIYLKVNTFRRKKK